MLDWTQARLAERAGVSKTGLINIEAGRSRPTAATAAAIKHALEEAGITFTNRNGLGVRLRKDHTP